MPPKVRPTPANGEVSLPESRWPEVSKVKVPPEQEYSRNDALIPRVLPEKVMTTGPAVEALDRTYPHLVLRAVPLKLHPAGIVNDPPTLMETMSLAVFPAEAVIIRRFPVPMD